jgi:hypothetical protein
MDLGTAYLRSVFLTVDGNHARRLADGETVAEVKMCDAQAFVVENILGSKFSPDKQSIVVGLTTNTGECQLSFSPDLLTDLALIALKSKTVLDDKAASQPEKSDGLTAFWCNKWEIRKLANCMDLLFCFRHVSGAWVRFLLPREMAKPMRETLEIIEGRTNSVSAGGKRN